MDFFCPLVIHWGVKNCALKQHPGGEGLKYREKEFLMETVKHIIYNKCLEGEIWKFLVSLVTAGSSVRIGAIF